LADVTVAVVTDTCHYLPKELVEANDIRQVSLYVHRDGRAERESDIDDYDGYYAELGAVKQLPTTSQPSIGDFLEVYEPLLQDHDEVVSIHLAGGMSGTVSAAQQAAEHLGGRVHVLDSSSACGGEGLVVLAAAAAARNGADGETVAAKAKDARAELRLWFAIDTLEFLRRGGRIAGAQAWLGSALQIKPILTVEHEITPIERVRTSRRAFERMVDLLRSCHDEDRDAWVVQHIQAPDQAQELVRRGREIFRSEPTFVSEVGPVIGTHVGPGLLGAGGLPQTFL
jgi:DegV family protein with EDD domain